VTTQSRRGASQACSFVRPTQIAALFGEQLTLSTPPHGTYSQGTVQGVSGRVWSCAISFEDLKGIYLSYEIDGTSNFAAREIASYIQGSGGLYDATGRATVSKVPNLGTESFSSIYPANDNHVEYLFTRKNNLIVWSGASGADRSDLPPISELTAVNIRMLKALSSAMSR
jgi:hypothetical protein